jgi:GNAT superfamily N-acetyltransferase
LIGTVTLYKEDLTSPCEYYRKPGVFSFGQFGIMPSLQGRGLGSFLMDMLESRAKELGALELALDTSERADNLIRMYTKRGYCHVGYTKWDLVNYRSVIMSKTFARLSSKNNSSHLENVTAP